MSVSGNLRTLELSELLQWLAQGTKTGTLEITSGESEVRIFFERGRILGSESNDPAEHLGTLLVEHGLIDRPTLDHAMKLQVATRILLGKVLVTLGFLSEEDLDRILRLKALETICKLFHWPEGEFRFRRDELPRRDMVPLSLEVTDVLMEGLRRLDEAGQAAPAAQTLPAAEPLPAVESLEAGESEPEWEPESVVGVDPAPPEPSTPEPAETRSDAGAAEPDWTPPPPPARPELEPFAPAAGVGVATASGASGPGRFSSSRRLAAAAAGLLVLGALGWAYLQTRTGSAESGEARTAPAARPLFASVAPFRIEAAAPPADAEPPPPAPEAAAGEQPVAGAEDLEAEVDRLLEARSAELEDSLRIRYEAEIERLRAEVARARELAATADREPAGQPANGTPSTGVFVNRPPATAPPSTGPAGADSDIRLASLPVTRGASSGTGAGASQPDNASRPPDSGRPVEDPASTSPGAAGAAAADDASDRAARPADPSSGSATGAAATPGEPVAAPGPTAPEVLETAPPRLLRMPTARYPPAARRLQREATVAVRLLIDESGVPTEVELAGERAGLGFDEAALEAARRSRWQPATREGVALPIWVNLSVEFRN